MSYEPSPVDDLNPNKPLAAAVKTSVAIVVGNNKLFSIREYGRKDGLKRTRVNLDIGGRAFSIVDD